LQLSHSIGACQGVSALLIVVVVLERLSHVDLVRFVHLDALGVHGWGPLVTTGPFNEELPCPVVSIEPIPDVIMPPNQLEYELEVSLHPLEESLVQLHDLQVTL
jgi:hypothetical protein